MTDKSGFASAFATISRRDAIRLIAATPASGAVAATSLPGVAAAATAALADDAGGRFPHSSAAAMRSLARLAASHFEPLVGEAFSIGGDRVILAEVRRGPASGGRFREQFALTFSAPQRPMSADVVPVSHPAIGRHDLHVASINGSALEICFS